MIFQNKKIKKFIAGLIILGFMTPSLIVISTPKPAEAQFTDFVNAALKTVGNIFAGAATAGTTTSTAISVKSVLKDISNQILKVIAKRALASMTKSTVNWINNGFHGSPLFVQNPQSLFKDITRSEIKDLIGIIGYDQVRFPFGKQFALNTIDAYKRQLSTNAEYSLSRVVNDPTLVVNYQNNFSIGGWDGLILNTQYPNNNYYGSQMQLTNELGNRLRGTSQNATEKVATALQQGQGFLSPQICPASRNPNYPKNVNPFDPPTFNDSEYKRDNPYNPPTDTDQTPIGGVLLNQATVYDIQYNTAKAKAKADFNAEYSCPGGLVTTTPGSVVANSIMTSLSSGTELTELQAALGGSLSAVFDALLNKFLGSGLSSIASNINTPPQDTDNWDYLGNTLGSPADNINGNSDPYNTPDQEINVLALKILISGQTETIAANGTIIIRPGNTVNGTYLSPTDPADPNNPRIAGKYIPGNIANTEQELSLLDNSDPKNFGLSQMLTLIWQKSRELDICTPGPDLGWEDRLVAERDRNSSKLQEKQSDTDANTAYRASTVFKELKFAVDFFEDWLHLEIIKSSGPNDLGLPGSIIFIDAVSRVRELDQQGVELTSTKRARTDVLARLQSIQKALTSQDFAVQPTQNSQQEKDLITIRRQYDNLSDSISNSTTIENARTAVATSIEQLSNLYKLVGQCTIERIQEGWSVPNFSSAGPIKNWGDTLNQGSTFTSRISGGIQSILQRFDQAGQNAISLQNRAKLDLEIEQFCGEPIAYGYSHGSFVNPWQENIVSPFGGTGFTVNRGLKAPYPDVPLVNARKVFTYSSGLFGWGSSDVNITLDCNTIFRSTILDYKGNLPSLPGLGIPAQAIPPPDPDRSGLPGSPNVPGDDTGTPPNNGNPNPPDTDCGATEPCG